MTEMTFLDQLYAKLSDTAKTKQMWNFVDWMNDNEYDSDAIIADMYDSKHSSIAQHLANDQETLNKITKYVNGNVNNTVTVIGISGATRSGKSTLSHYLRTLLGKDNCQTIHQDDYFNMMKIWKELNNNWDHPKAINHDAFYKKVHEQINYYKTSISINNISKQTYIILEGFMLYWDHRIVQSIDLFIWLEIPRNICYQRRMGTKRETSQYFKNNIWPNHEQYKAKVFDTKNKQLKDKNQIRIKDRLLIIDGTSSVDHVVKVSLKHIGKDYTIDGNSND